MSKIRDQFLGCGCVLISNSCYLSVSYLTKYQKVSPGEIMTTCAVFQLVVFGIQFLVQHFKTPPFERKSLKYDWKTWTALTLANILMTSMNIVCFIAVKMLPLSDFVVLCFTSPKSKNNRKRLPLKPPSMPKWHEMKKFDIDHYILLIVFY